MRYEEDQSSGEERFFQDIPSKTALRIVCIVVALFGGMLMASGGDRVSRAPRADAFFMLLLGCGIIFSAWRFWKVTTGPRMVLSTREVILRKFFRYQRWQVDDISSIASFPTVIYPRSPRGQNLGPMNVHFLGIKARRGKVSKFVLPQFEGNEQLLASLAAKTKRIIENIEDDAAFEAWRNSGN